MFYSPLSLSIFIFLLFHNFIIFPPQFFLLLFPPLQFYYSPPFLNSLLFLNFDLYPPPPHFWFASSTIFIIFPLQSWFSFSSTSSFMFFHSQIHGLHIDPTSTLDSTFFQHCFGNSETAEGNNRNVMVVVVGKRNVEVVVYCFTIHEAVLKKSRWGRCRVDARSMYLWIEKHIE